MGVENDDDDDVKEGRQRPFLMRMICVLLVMMTKMIYEREVILCIFRLNY